MLGLCIWLLTFTVTTTGPNVQQYDLAAQFRIIKDLMPESTRLGILFNPRQPNIEALISNASTDTGFVVIKAPIARSREMTAAVRSLVRYDVDFIYMVEDRTVTGTSSIRFVVRQSSGDRIPVFTMSPNAFKGNAFGWIVPNGSSWRIKINGKTVGDYDVDVPDNALFSIEE
jgi:ABC-type uncharacterized transport system substrate-binding protein